MNKHPLADCDNCPLKYERMAATNGPTDAKVALVSRSPGSYDVSTGRPFSNPHGSKKIVDFLLSNSGVGRADILATNLVLCYSEDPPKAAINACRPRLLSELENATTVIAAGAEAVRELIGPISLSKARGLEHQKGEKRIIATNNPAAVLYDSDIFPNLVEDFKLALEPPLPYKKPQVTIYNTADEGKTLLTKLMEYDGIIATDLEGHMPHIECAGFAINDYEAHVMSRNAVMENWDLFKTFYESGKHWLWHNGVYDTKLLRRNEIHSRITDDTFPLSYVLDERTLGVHKLEYLARTKLGWGNYEPTSVEHYKETGELPDDINELYEYNGYDCCATFQLFSILEEAAIKDDTYNLYKHHMVPLLNALVDVELRGFHYDHIAAANLNEEIVIPEIRRLVGEMRKIVGLEFYNPASTKQVGAFIYDTGELKHTLKDTKTKKFTRSFRKEVRTEVMAGRFESKSKYKEKLIRYAEFHDVWSEIDKQRGTYIEGLIRLVGPDGKLYCSFNPCGTVTGRTSSRFPNFQNITRTDKHVVPSIRNLFKPSPGNVIVQADYSQAELRCIAQFSQDAELLNIYRNSSRSLHKETASAFYGANYTKEQYVKSKNINFGVPYGQSAFAFSQMYHMPQKEAQAYIDNWFKTFPGVQKWIEETHKIIYKDNYLVSPYGFKRRFYLITDENIEAIKREGVNFLPQNTAGSFTTAALIELNKQGIPIISTVHDSIIADVPTEEARDVAILMKEVMEAQPGKSLGWNDLPFTAEVSIGETWGAVEEVENIEEWSIA